VAKSVRVEAGRGGSFFRSSRMVVLLKMRPEAPNSMKLSASNVAFYVGEKGGSRFRANAHSCDETA